MPKITSTDALIDRIRVAYPGWVRLLVEIREYMEQGWYAAVYDRLNNSGFGRTYSYSTHHEELLAAVDDDGNVIPEKFAELVERARRDIEDAALEPVRWQLQKDFRDSYEFTWIPDF